MRVLAWPVLMLLGAAPAPSQEAARLSRLVDDIRAADYRARRGELRELAAALDAVRSPDLVPYRDYWRGFALWRRAINGFNETPFPPDLKADLQAAMLSFRASLARRPGWVEAQAGLVGSAANLLFLAGDDEERKKPLLAEFVPMLREITEKGKDNPRVLWLVGGFQAWAPAPRGGDFPRATATYLHGLEAARREALASGADPAWVPDWGAPEILMSLAYLHSHSTPPNLDLARAYAEGALAAVPHWHYVGDILLPQLQAPAPAAATPAR